MANEAHTSRMAPDGPAAGLAGLRVLVVEDEALIAIALEDILTDLGCEVVGPAATVEEAVRLIEDPIDGALLDVNLRGVLVYPVADALIGRGVPVVLCSGYAMTSEIPAAYATVPQIAKPYDQASVRNALAVCLKGRQRRRATL